MANAIHRTRKEHLRQSIGLDHNEGLIAANPRHYTMLNSPTTFFRWSYERSLREIFIFNLSNSLYDNDCLDRSKIDNIWRGFRSFLGSVSVGEMDVILPLWTTHLFAQFFIDISYRGAECVCVATRAIRQHIGALVLFCALSDAMLIIVGVGGIASLRGNG